MPCHSRNSIPEGAWILGDSIASWAKPAYEQELLKQPWKYPNLRKQGIKFFGVRGQKLDKLVPTLCAKLDTVNPWPAVIFVHLGTNNINSDTSVSSLVDVVSAVFAEVMATIDEYDKRIKIVWSDMLPRLTYKNMSFQTGTKMTNNVNASAQYCTVAQGHYFVSHPYIDTQKPAMYRHANSIQDPVHLSQFGYHIFLTNLDLSLRQLIPVPLLEVAYPPPRKYPAPVPRQFLQGPL